MKSLVTIIAILILGNSLFCQSKMCLNFNYNGYDISLLDAVDFLIVSEDNRQTLIYVPKNKALGLNPPYYPTEYFEIFPEWKHVSHPKIYIAYEDNLIKSSFSINQFDSLASDISLVSSSKISQEEKNLICYYNFIRHRKLNGHEFVNVSSARESYLIDYGNDDIKYSQVIHNTKAYFKKNKEEIMQVLKGEFADSIQSSSDHMKSALLFYRNDTKVTCQDEEVALIFIAEGTSGRVLIKSRVTNGTFEFPQFLHRYSMVDIIFVYKDLHFQFCDIEVAHLRNTAPIEIYHKTYIDKGNVVYKDPKLNKAKQKVHSIHCYTWDRKYLAGEIVYDLSLYHKKNKEALQIFLKNNSDFKQVFY